MKDLVGDHGRIINDRVKIQKTVFTLFQSDPYPDWNYHNVRGIACLAEHKPMGAQESFAADADRGTGAALHSGD